MAPVDLGPVAVVGLGAIGGSVARSLKRAGVRGVRGHTASAADADAARRAGLDVGDDLARCVDGAPLVLIAVPMTVHAEVASRVVDAAAPDAIILHTASLQATSALALAGGDASAYPAHVARRVVGTHPLAGSHRAGFAAADPTLLEGCVVSVEARADDAVRSVAERLWRAAGAGRIEYRTAEEHDELMTWVSHLPQLASTALAHAIHTAGVPASALGPGGRDATRLASSPLEIWGGILAGARPGAARATAALERSVAALRRALEADDADDLSSVWSSAREWRDAADVAPSGPRSTP